MKSDNLFLVLAVIALVFSIAFLYSSIYNFNRGLFTGFVTNTGIVNITVESAAAINFTTNNINFQSGRVNVGSVNSTLDTSVGTVTNGNWTANSAGFVIENIGNNNVTLDLATGKTAATFLGGTSPLYQYNVSDIEPLSCLNSTYGTSALNLGVFTDVNITSPGTRICNVFAYTDANDKIRIDVKLVVPSDSVTGALSDTWTTTATGCSGVPCA